MKRWVGVILAVLAAILVGAFWYFSSSRVESHLASPTFMLPDAKGKIIKSDDLVGQASLIHFWASWCPPCAEELPELMEAAAQFSPDRLRFVLISNDQDWDGAMKLITQGKQSPSLLLLLDAESKVAERFGTFQLPETYLVGKNGKILMKWIGPQKWNSPAFKKGLEELLQPDPKR